MYTVPTILLRKFHLVWEDLGILLATCLSRYSTRLGEREKKAEKPLRFAKKTPFEESEKLPVEE